MRDTDRISKVRVGSEVNVDVRITSGGVKKFLRKDFNYLSCYMFFYQQRAEEIQQAFDIAERKINFAEKETSDVIIVSAVIPLQVEEFNVRLISPEASKLLRLLRRLDKIDTTLVKAEVLGHIDRNTRNAIVKPVYAAIQSIKEIATGQRKRDPAKEKMPHLKAIA